MELYLVSLARRAHDPGLSLTFKHMAWRPYQNLIDGELDNTSPGKVTGWMRFFGQGRRPLRVTFDLTGDFHEDIRGKRIRLKNDTASDRSAERDRTGTYMAGFAPVQRGTVGDITAGRSLGPWTDALAQKLMAQNELIWEENGLVEPAREQHRKMFAERYRQHIAQGDPYYPYVDYPYIEWYSETNGRVVLELDPSQVEVLEKEGAPQQDKTPRELVKDRKRREQAFGAFLSGMVNDLSKENVRKGGDGNVTSIVI